LNPEGILGFFRTAQNCESASYPGSPEANGTAPLGLAEIIGCDVGNDKHFNAAAIFTMARRGDR